MKGALHNLSHPVKLSMDQGQIIPIGLVEALPADVMDHSSTCLIRTQPLVSPVMHEVDAKIHHWFVPTRTIWDDFPNLLLVVRMVSTILKPLILLLLLLLAFLLAL